MDVKERKKLLRALNLPFCLGEVWKFLATIKHFTPADLEQLEYGIRLIREQEQAEAEVNRKMIKQQAADHLAFCQNQN